jgi:uncharacterized protein YlxP (DUF503 family)
VHVLAAEVEFHLPVAPSLKEKRRLRQSLLARWWRMHLAAAEVAAADVRERLVLGVAAVGGDPRVLERRMAAVEAMCYALAEAEVVRFEKGFR